jgi:hypothetical protein
VSSSAAPPDQVRLIRPAQVVVVDQSESEFVGLWGERGALGEYAVELSAEQADAPALDPAHLDADDTHHRIIQRDQRDEMGPARFAYRRYDNLRVGEHLGELDLPS